MNISSEDANNDETLIAIVIYLWCLGTRTFRSQRLPPPGTLITRSVPVLSGQAAQQRAHLVQDTAALPVIAVVVLAILFWWLAE